MIRIIDAVKWKFSPGRDVVLSSVLDLISCVANDLTAIHDEVLLDANERNEVTQNLCLAWEAQAGDRLVPQGAFCRDCASRTGAVNTYIQA